MNSERIFKDKVSSTYIYAICINNLKLVVAHLLIGACADASTTNFEPINL